MFDYPLTGRQLSIDYPRFSSIDTVRFVTEDGHTWDGYEKFSIVFRTKQEILMPILRHAFRFPRKVKYSVDQSQPIKSAVWDKGVITEVKITNFRQFLVRYVNV